MVLLLITIGCVLIERNRRRRQSDHEITHDAIPFESFQGSRPFDSFKGKDDHQIQRAERHIYSNVPEQPKDNHGYPSTIELPDDLEKLRKFSKEDMIYIDCLGEGAFGKVLNNPFYIQQFLTERY